ncbi:hypothetical protein GXW82_32155 [Streptacidiphilus sp. 4-A2]|nr:hypothetical protein [Streptacidiphilus sp. 4-A2]
MIARHEVDYRRQLHHRADQPLPLQVWVTAIGTNSYTVAPRPGAEEKRFLRPVPSAWRATTPA